MPRGIPPEVQQAQADHPGAMTRGQLRRLLGLSESTIKRYIKDGRIPVAEFELPNGWRLWSDAQVKELLTRRITLGLRHHHRV